MQNTVNPGLKTINRARWEAEQRAKQAAARAESERILVTRRQTTTTAVRMMAARVRVSS